MDRYTYRAEWSPDYDNYVGVCIELPYLQRQAPTAPQAVAAVEQAVNQHVDDGTLVVRTSPELHARLALEAIEQRVSMNQWVVQKLSGRDLGGGFGSFGFDEFAVPAAETVRTMGVVNRLATWEQ